VLKHRVRNEQTSGEKKSPSKGVLIYYFFPAHMQIFRPIGHTFGSQRERVKKANSKVLLGRKIGQTWQRSRFLNSTEIADILTHFEVFRPEFPLYGLFVGVQIFNDDVFLSSPPRMFP
jgi:hypothetical protein